VRRFYFGGACYNFPEMPSNLVRTKLIPPEPRTDYVSRPRLLARIANPKRGRVTVVTAPAGYGKTTLLADWCARQKTRIAWVALEPSENDPALFWQYVAAALGVEVARGERPTATGIVNALAQGSQYVTLVLDDLHVIETQAIWDDLAKLVEHAPHTLSFVLAARAVPNLPLARWRARGQLNELRAQQLAFTLPEARAFLATTMQLDVETETVTRLEKMTEGWAAGLQLAALAWQTEGAAAGGGIARAHIFEYLAGEVFAGQSRTIRKFLLDTCILERCNASLANAVTGRKDSAKLLAQLERSNLFTSAFEGEETWYRYHPLFAEFLGKRLAAEGEAHSRQLHERAAVWLAQHGSTAEAISHFLAAHAFERAADWIDAACEGAMERGELTTMLRWLDALPREVVAKHHSLNLWYGWVLSLHARFDEMERHLKQAETLVRRFARGNAMWKPELRRTRGKVAAIRAQAGVLQKDDARVLEWSERALALLPEPMNRERSVAWLNRAQVFRRQGKLDEAERAYKHAERESRTSEHPFIRVGVLYDYARLLVERNETQQAEQLLKQALDYARENNVLAMAEPAKRLLDDIAAQWNEAKNPEALSAREQEILEWLARGESNRQIAERLGIGTGTVNWHTKNIYKKLGVRNRTEAARGRLNP
jgi:LuxR family transcriptional regulator, maltose regulon positive regulatory protein